MKGVGGAAVVANEVAAEQGGIATTAQLVQRGVSRVQLARLVEAGTIERLHQGIYRVAGWPFDRLDPVRLGWIATDTARTASERLSEPESMSAVVSHESAAVVLGLGDLPGDVVELTSRRRIRLRLPDVRIHTDPALAVNDWTVVDGLAVTTALRTIADLAAARADADHLGVVMREAMQRELVTVHGLFAVLQRHAGAYGYSGPGPFVGGLLDLAGISENVAALASQPLMLEHARGFLEGMQSIAPLVAAAPAQLTSVVTQIDSLVTQMRAAMVITPEMRKTLQVLQSPEFAAKFREASAMMQQPTRSHDAAAGDD